MRTGVGDKAHHCEPVWLLLSCPCLIRDDAASRHVRVKEVEA